MQLDVRNLTSIEAALEAYVAGDPISGYTTPDGSTVDATKRVCLGTLPHTLIVQFKRFEFDYDTMVKVKLFDEISFPHVLDVSPFVAEAGRIFRYRLYLVLAHRLPDTRCPFSRECARSE